MVSAHNGCLQMEVTVHGEMAHAAVPETGVDALQGAVRILNALYAQNARYREVRSQVPGITHPYLNVGRIEGGTNTNVVPGKVSFKLDRRMIPEENAAEVEADIHRVIEDAAATFPGIRVEIKRLLLANAMRPLPGNKPLVDAIQRHGREIFGEDIPALGTALHRRAAVCGGRHPRRDLRRRPAHGAGVPRQAQRRTRRAGRPAPRHQVIARALADLLQPQ